MGDHAVRVLTSLQDVEPAEWDALVGEGSPFLEHAFLSGLEAYGCAVPETGWAPRPVLLFDEGALVGAAPAWLKSHSMGEYVYDHSWAEAAQRAGHRYYPKLVVAAPFSPVTGARLLVKPGQDLPLRREQLLAGLDQIDAVAQHLLFNPQEEAEALAARGLFTRVQFQFHWENQAYQSFEGWLARGFKSKARNKLRRERREVKEAVQIEVIEGPDAAMVDTLYGLYRGHCEQFGPWGRAYLSRDFFQYLGRVWGHRLHAVVARRQGDVVAGAFNVRKGDTLYGRYWGCVQEIRFLHFEVCYYTPIEWAIAHGVKRFEPGHGGGHKYRRGFSPALTYSSHRFLDPRLHQAFRDVAAAEARAVRRQVEALHAHRGGGGVRV